MIIGHPVATRHVLPADHSAAAPAGMTVRQLVAGFSIEATPKQLQRADSLGSSLPAATRVYVPYLPRAAMADTVEACSRLVAQGLDPVPHLAARMLTSRDKLAEHLARLAETGSDSLLLIAGDRRRPAGPFKSTLDVCDTGLLQHYGFDKVGVAGHPEGHPVAGFDTLMNALRRKADYARGTGSSMWIVTQFAFSPDPVIAWLERLRAADIDLPVRVGLPGPAKPRTLLRYAVQCGVGASSRMLTRRPDAVTRLLGRWSPDRMLPALARHAAAGKSPPIEGIHIFPFGGLSKSIAWFTKL